METVGEYLQNARKARGLSLDEVASQTKISIRMLKALEADDFSQVPSEVFARGFVRSYAKCLGLSEGEVFRRFRESTGSWYAQRPKSEPVSEPSAPAAERKRLGNQIITVGVVVAVATLIALVIYERTVMAPVPVLDDLDVRPSSPAQEAQPVEPVGERPDRFAPSSSPELTVNVPGGVASAPRPENADLLLVIEATERSWIVAEIDGSQIKEVLLKPGEVVRWRAKEKFVLTVGNAGGVNLQFNGKTLESLGPKGKVVRDIILPQ